MDVAVYCRVSTDKNDQLNSFESQRRYFEQYILQSPGLNLYKIYADRGATGTSTAKRPAFNQMIRDARQHKFAQVITKEISRFARNLLDSVYYTRLLKSYGVGVLFINDNINTLDSDSDLLFALKSTLAQEESRAISQRIKWGQSRSMEKGVVFGRSLLGFNLKGGALEIDEQGAKTVRLIFYKYVYEQMGAGSIARYLNKINLPSPSGQAAWNPGTILKIIKNEKYCGDLKQKKTITTDYLSHHKAINRGSEPFIFIKDHHPAIIERSLWQQAQIELGRRAHKPGASGHGTRHTLSGRIKCQQCGKSLCLRTRKRKDGTTYATWRCIQGCALNYQLNDQIINDMLKTALQKTMPDLKSIKSALTLAVKKVIADRAGGQQKLKNKLYMLKQKKKRVLNAYFSNTISKADMLLINNQYTSEIEQIKSEINSLAAPPLDKDISKAVKGALDFIDNPAFLFKLADYIYAGADKQIKLKLKGINKIFRFKLLK